MTKLNKIHTQQGHAASIVFHENKLYCSSSLLQSRNALSVYQINIYQGLNFMYKFNNNQSLVILNNLIKNPNHSYPTDFSDNDFILKKCSLNSAKNSIFVRGPKVGINS